MNIEMLEQMSKLLGVSRDDLVTSDKELEFIEKTAEHWSIAVKRKIDDIKKSGAEVVVTACPMCMRAIMVGAQLYGLKVQVKHIAAYIGAVSYTHLTLPTTPYV